MKNLIPASTIVLAATLLICLPFSTYGDEDDAVSPADAGLTINEAIEIALNQISGLVVESELEKEDGTLVWEVAILDAESQMIEVVIDANSGVILSQEKDD